MKKIKTIIRNQTIFGLCKYLLVYLWDKKTLSLFSLDRQGITNRTNKNYDFEKFSHRDKFDKKAPWANDRLVHKKNHRLTNWTNMLTILKMGTIYSFVTITEGPVAF